MRNFTKRQRESLPDERTPEEIAIWERVRADMKEMRRLRRERGQREDVLVRKAGIRRVPVA